MPSQRQYRTVEVVPESMQPRKSKNTTPASPGSPKAVRFAKETIVKAEPREPTPAEAWSFYHFESHARLCSECRDPDVIAKGHRLCTAGHALAQDVAVHVYRKDGAYYCREKDNHKLVQVEMLDDYNQTKQLLRSMEKALRTTHRPVPIISYDRTYPVSLRPERENDEESYTTRGGPVIIEPASTADRMPRRHSSLHKSQRYSTVVVDEDPQPKASEPEKKERRGSLYHDDLRRQKKEVYRVEVREPEAERRERRRNRDRRPVNEYYY